MAKQESSGDEENLHLINFVALVLLVPVMLALLFVLVANVGLRGEPLATSDFGIYTPNVGSDTAWAVELPGGRVAGSEAGAGTLFGLGDADEVQVQLPEGQLDRFYPTAVLICPESATHCEAGSGEEVRFELCEVHEQDDRQWDLIFTPTPCRVPTGANPLKFVFRVTDRYTDAGLVWGPILPSESADLAINVLADVNSGVSSKIGAERLVRLASEDGFYWAANTGLRTSRDDRTDTPRVESGTPGIHYKQLTGTAWLLFGLGASALLLFGVSSTPPSRLWRIVVVIAKLTWPFRAGNGTAAVSLTAFLVAFTLAPQSTGEAFFSTAAQVNALLLFGLGLELRSFGLGDMSPLRRRKRIDDDLEELEKMADEGAPWRPLLSVVAVLMLAAGLIVSLAALGTADPGPLASRTVFGAVAGGTTALALLAITGPRGQARGK